MASWTGIPLGLLLGPGGLVGLLCLMGRISDGRWLAFWKENTRG